MPAGEEVTVRYRIVRFDELSEVERTKIQRDDGVDVAVFVNGEERTDV